MSTKRTKPIKAVLTNSGRRPLQKRAKQAMPRLSLRKTPRLAPGDPQATSTGTLPGAGAVGNTILTDTDYAMGTEDQTVLVVQNGATITLALEPLQGYPVFVVADGGIVVVTGPIQGGAQTLAQGTVGIYEFSANSEMWSSVVGGGSSSGTFGYHTTAINYTTVSENELVNVTAGGVTVTIGTGFNAVTVKDRTGSPTPTIGIAAQSGADLEDPNNLGNAADFATTVYLKQPGGAVSFRYDGTIYEVVGTT